MSGRFPPAPAYKETVRVDICYRPIRVGWILREGDVPALHRAVRYSTALWGGQFNPILVAGNGEPVDDLVRLFRPDILFGLDDSESVTTLTGRYPYLPLPFFHRELFYSGSDGYGPWAQLLDVHNAVRHGGDRLQHWKDRPHEFVLPDWDDDDPLALAHLAQYGQYPEPSLVGTDYAEIVLAALGGTRVRLEPGEPIHLCSPSTTTPIGVSGIDLRPLPGSPRGVPAYGYYVGDSARFADVVNFWNLRATGHRLLFIDPTHELRLRPAIQEWAQRLAQRRDAGLRGHFDRPSVWYGPEMAESATEFARANAANLHALSTVSWNGLNLKAPTMMLGRRSALGIVSQGGESPQLTFAHPERPFATNQAFFQQHLVASISAAGSLFREDHHSFSPPYLPELNNSYSRHLTYRPDCIRSEPGRVGLIVRTSEDTSSLFALRVADLFESALGLAGYKAVQSSAGRITKQVIQRLGGLQGCRVFKVPGTRRLIREHGPRKTFPRSEALRLLGSSDPGFSATSFGDHKHLHITSRPPGTDLTPQALLSYLVESNLYLIGSDFVCPECELVTWKQLGQFGEVVDCDMCGVPIDTRTQLLNRREWGLRRSGILGIERNVQGAVPVCLALQQLDTSFQGFRGESHYSPSLELRESAGGECMELDLVWLIGREYGRRTAVILGECKDGTSVTAENMQRLETVANAFPRQRFKVFILLAQLAPFTPPQIKAALELNKHGRERVILLSAKHLEPYDVYSIVNREEGTSFNGSSPEEMARATAALYFAKPPEAAKD